MMKCAILSCKKCYSEIYDSYLRPNKRLRWRHSIKLFAISLPNYYIINMLKWKQGESITGLREVGLLGLFLIMLPT